MLLKIVKKDLLRNKVITAALFVFILLSAVLVASGANMIVELSGALDHLFVASKAPHFVQMHSGALDQAEIERWAKNNSLVTGHQVVELLNIDGSNVYLSKDGVSEKDSVMDLDFVKQNSAFDLLLDLENKPVSVSPGQIAVPILYMQTKNLKLGDKVRLATRDFRREFTVTAFVRDAQMNPSVVHSKRFVVNPADLEILKANLGEVEYLIEFQIADLSKVGQFATAYQTSNLPRKGPAVDYNLFKMLGALTDGMVAFVIILVSLLLILVALLCLRFTILSTIEEDYREIGVMKAIGIQPRDIRSIYLAKYVALAASASGLGYFASRFLGRLVTANITLYLGTAPKGLFQYSVPILAVCLIFLMVVTSCLLILRRMGRISAVEALRSGNAGGATTARRRLSLSKSTLAPVNVFLGVTDVLQRFKMFSLLFFVFSVCSFIVIVPVNFLNTMQSPDIVTYMGIGRSDIRIDLRQSDDVAERWDSMLASLKADRDVRRFSPLVTSQFKVVGDDGVQENISVETGDFPDLNYMEGKAPRRDDEIALSYLSGKEMNKRVGDRLPLVMGGQVKEMVVSGIYQDVTNGGRTAKARLPFQPETVLWYVVSLDVNPGVDISSKIDQYTRAFYPARVTDLKGYLAQTLGSTIDQLKLATVLAAVIAMSVSVLITSLFLKMLVAKDYSQIAILKSIGFSLGEIRAQYITRALLVLGTGIALGTVIANTLGQSVVSGLMSFMGAASIKFVIDPVQAYVLCPLALMITVTLTAVASMASIKKSSVAQMIVE